MSRCPSTMKDQDSTWYCSLDLNHPGDHRAHTHHMVGDGNPVRTWQNDNLAVKDDQGVLSTSLMGNLIYLLNDIKELMVENNELLKDIREQLGA